jgi:hypothetical protein
MRSCARPRRYRRLPIAQSSLKVSAPVEVMAVTLKATGDNKGTLTIAWDKLTASAPFTAQ